MTDYATGVTGTRTRTRTHTRTRTGFTSVTKRSRLAVARKRLRTANGKLQTALSFIQPLGWLIIGAICVALWCALSWQWADAWHIVIAGLILVFTATPFLLGSNNYSVRIQMPKQRVTVDNQLTGELLIGNNSAAPMPGSLAELHMGSSISQIRVPFISPGGNAPAHQINVDTSVRGVQQIGPLQVRRSDPLGLMRREMTWDEKLTVFVRPKIAYLPGGSAGLVRDLDGSVSAKLTAQDLEFHAIRPYQIGDEQRNVHWKSTAKTGALMVRQFDETQTSHVAVLLDTQPASYAGPDEFEVAVSCAASFALHAVRRGHERYIASAWDPQGLGGIHEIPSRNPDTMMDNFAALTSADNQISLETQAMQLLNSRRQVSHVVMVTGSQMEMRPLRAIYAMFPKNTVGTVVQSAHLSDPKVQKTGNTVMLTVGDVADLPGLLVKAEVSGV